MDKPLTFIESPVITIGTNHFLCNIPIRYKDTPMLEVIKELTTFNEETFTTKIPIFHSDGTKLAVVKGNQIFRTEEGEKAGVTLRNPAGVTVCELNGKPVFEIRRKGAAALKMNAELHTFDGAFLRWSEEELSGLLTVGESCLQLGSSKMTNCSLQGVVGIQIGAPNNPLPTCFMLDFKK